MRDYDYKDLLSLIDDMDYENLKWQEIQELISIKANDTAKRVDLRGLFRILRYFPPNGEPDNLFILKLKKAFGIN